MRLRPRQGLLVAGWAAALGGAAWAQPRLAADDRPLPAAAVTAAGADVRAGKDLPATLVVVAGAPLRMAQAQPGDRATTSFGVRNDGRGAARVALAPGAVADRPGRGGGLLSTRIVLTVRRAGGEVLFRGTAAELGTASLGVVPPRQEERFTLDAAFPDGGTPSGPLSGDNAFQGAALDLALDVQAR